LVPTQISVAGCNLSNEGFLGESNDFVIAPNPSKNMLTIINNQNTKIDEVNIYNTLGQLIKNIVAPNQTIDISNLQSANYFMKIVTNNGISTQKFIKE
ncbi:MAG: T9SS type A sorting domain-containing protein, partial [Flavobacterium sp.]|nr:T9SS type A sorting domain-containing protein [Flavobacterium sp.]